MLKRTLLGLCVVILVAGGSAMGQAVCPLNGTSSKNLICLIPQIYGPFGLSSQGPLLATGHAAHFDNDFVAQFRPISTAVGTQLSSLPLASPSSGITFVYDPALKTFSPATEQTLGPILGERADTIGRNRVYVGFSYQYFNFDTIDGTDLGNIPAVFQHVPFKTANPCPNQEGLTPGKYAGDPCFMRDFIQTSNSIDLTIHQYTFYATYGLTRHLDVSVAIPILDVRMNVRSNATIVANAVADPSLGLVPCGTGTDPCPVFHAFDPAFNTPSAHCGSKGSDNMGPCLQGTFSDSGSASGIGDVVFRGKYEVYKGEHAGFALGLDVRAPTGDERNYLGSGSAGIKPFGVFSYNARISPHVEMGYEVNGSSILAGNFIGAANTTGTLPNRFIYIVGADASVTKRLTAAFDLYGQHLSNTPRLVPTTYTDLGKCSDPDCTPPITAGTTHPNVSGGSSTLKLLDISLGLKLRLLNKVVVTGNVLIKANDEGLRAKAIPLVGVGYSF